MRGSTPWPTLSSRRRTRPRSRNPPRILARFNLADPAERDAVRWIAFFHSKDGIYRLLALRRGQTVEGKRAIWMLTRSCVARPRAKPQWLLISYWLDEIRVTLPSYPTLRVARAAFEVAAASPHPSSVRPPAPQSST